MSQAIRQAVLASGMLREGHFVFAAGDHAVRKLDADYLWEHPEPLAVVLAGLARADGLPPADVLLGVPRGGQYLADRLGGPEWLGLPVVQLERVPGGAKQDFRFASEADRELALDAKSPRIYEDIVTTLSSVAGVVRLLEPERQDIHALAIWRRGELRPEYASGVTPHFLVEEPMLSYAPSQCPVCAS